MDDTFKSYLRRQRTLKQQSHIDISNIWENYNSSKVALAQFQSKNENLDSLPQLKSIDYTNVLSSTVNNNDHYNILDDDILDSVVKITRSKSPDFDKSKLFTKEKAVNHPLKFTFPSVKSRLSNDEKAIGQNGSAMVYPKEFNNAENQKIGTIYPNQSNVQTNSHAKLPQPHGAIPTNANNSIAPVQSIERHATTANTVSSSAQPTTNLTITMNGNSKAVNGKKELLPSPFKPPVNGKNGTSQTVNLTDTRRKPQTIDENLSNVNDGNLSNGANTPCSIKMPINQPSIDADRNNITSPQNTNASGADQILQSAANSTKPVFENGKDKSNGIETLVGEKKEPISDINGNQAVIESDKRENSTNGVVPPKIPPFSIKLSDSDEMDSEISTGAAQALKSPDDYWI